MLGRYAPGTRRAGGPVPVIADVRKKYMQFVLPYLVAVIVCHICYLIAQIPFGILTPIARSGPRFANYLGTIMAFGAAMSSVAVLLLIPMIFPKVTLILPALLRFLSDFTRWSRSSNTLNKADSSTHENISGLERATQVEAGAIWGSLIGYLLAANTILRESPIF